MNPKTDEGGIRIRDKFYPKSDVDRLWWPARVVLRYEAWAQSSWLKLVFQTTANLVVGGAGSWLAIRRPDLFKAIVGVGWRFAYIMLALVFAFGLFALRKFARTTYGTIEPAFAAMSMWQLSGNLNQNKMTLTIGAVGSLYVMVRGMVNIADGQTTEEDRESWPFVKTTVTADSEIPT
jgi:hypothetical protein